MPARGDRITIEQALDRWPALARACQWVAILSGSEAGCALRDFSNRSSGSCEAVEHYGGAGEVVRDAWRLRHMVPARRLPQAR